MVAAYIIALSASVAVAFCLIGLIFLCRHRNYASCFRKPQKRVVGAVAQELQQIIVPPSAKDPVVPTAPPDDPPSYAEYLCTLYVTEQPPSYEQWASQKGPVGVHV